MKKHIVKKLVIVVIIFSVVITYKTFINAENLPSRYNLKDYINIEVRDQKDTNTCWAFSTCSLLSSHLAFINNENYSFSPRHMEYTMSEDSIVDKENIYAYKNKKLEYGGNENIVKQYLVQGTGPVLEKNMPFQNDANKINDNELPIGLAYKQVVEAAHILPVSKEWVNGELIYKNHTGNLMDEQQIIEYKNWTKSAIKQYGGVEASFSYDEEFYDNSNGSYNSKETKGYWHSILLVGFDDNYSKNNFRENVRPLNDGAYIALNSWGDYTGDNGYIYISYEDVTIDMATKTYIKRVENVDYDNVYYGDLTVAKANKETLTELTLVVDSRITGYMHVSLRVNDEYVATKVLVDDCIENIKLETPVNLDQNTVIDLEIGVGEEFKQYIYPYYYTISNKSEFETGNLNSDILNAKDGNGLYIWTKHNVIDNGKFVNVKILRNGIDETSKFLITGNEIKNNQTGIYIASRDAYNDNYVLELSYDNIKLSKRFSIINGLEAGLNDKVNGDINLDGKVTVTDLSQLKLHLIKISILDGERKDACDINGDGKVTALDISKLKLKLVGMDL